MRKLTRNHLLRAALLAVTVGVATTQSQDAPAQTPPQGYNPPSQRTIEIWTPNVMGGLPGHAGPYYLTAANGGGLCSANPSVPLCTVATTPGPNEQFTLVPLTDPGWPLLGGQGAPYFPGLYALKTSGGYYVGMTNGGGLGGGLNDPGHPIHTDATKAGSWEKFTVSFAGSADCLGRGAAYKCAVVTLQSVDGHYLSATFGGGWKDPANQCPVQTSDVAIIHSWEKFFIQ
jgi:hypothetical protein